MNQNGAEFQIKVESNADDARKPTLDFHEAGSKITDEGKSFQPKVNNLSSENCSESCKSKEKNLNTAPVTAKDHQTSSKNGKKGLKNSFDNASSCKLDSVFSNILNGEKTVWKDQKYQSKKNKCKNTTLKKKNLLNEKESDKSNVTLKSQLVKTTKSTAKVKKTFSEHINPAQNNFQHDIQDIFETFASCRFCRKAFKTLSDSDNHSCDVSEIIKDSEQMNIYKCHLCKLSFTQNHHLERHLMGHKRNNCKFCNSQFTKRKALCKHLKNVHNITEPEKLYHCSFCEKSFSKRPSLHSHLKLHANGRPLCPMCGCMSESENAHMDHMKEHLKNSKFHCILCDKKFLRRQQYEQHMTGHDRHSCSSCDVTFSTKKLLLKHQQIIHGIRIVEKKYECLICNKFFLRPKHLQLHQRIHTGEKPVQCSHCEKSFCNERALAKHMKTVRHIQRVGIEEGKAIDIEKPFLCAECGAKFYRQQSLLRHMEQIHGPGEPLKCPHCEYSTKCKTNLKRHSELHTDNKRFVCEICGSSFHALATLKEHHAYVHSEDRSFVCHLCDKGFKGKSSLQRHMRIHSEDRPYKCHCDRDYKRMSHLKRHMISAHHMRFKTKKVKKIGDSSDTETTMSSQDAPPSLAETLEVLQNHSSCDDFPLLLTPNGNYITNQTKEPVMNGNLDDAQISSTRTSTEGEEYVTVPSDIVQTYLDESDAQIISDDDSKSSLITLISAQQNIHTAQTCLQADSHPSNPVVLNDSELNISPSNYHTFSLSTSPLSLIPMDPVASNLQDQLVPPNSSLDFHSISSAHENLMRPHSLPNLNLQHHETNMDSTDSFTQFSLHNGDSQTSTLSIPSFLLNNEITPQQQVSDIDLTIVGPMNSSRQLFGVSSDIIDLSPYSTSSALISVAIRQSDQLLREPRNTGVWVTANDDTNRIVNSEVATDTCINSSVVCSVSSFSTTLPQNLLFPGDPLMTCSIDTSSLNSEEFESLSSLC